MPLLREGEITTVDFRCTNSSKDKQIPGFGQQPAELFSSYILLALIPALLSYPLQLSAVTTVLCAKSLTNALITGRSF
jgi:hypothetical protein